MLGSVIAMNSPENIYELQKRAVENSRLHIPLMFCRDVIHGSQTIFPIPLAWSCSFDPTLIGEAGRDYNTSDFGAVEEAIAHGAAEDGKDAVCKAIRASMDIEMASGLYNTWAKEAFVGGSSDDADLLKEEFTVV